MSQRQVPCPCCGKLSPWSTDNPWRPFCSERCKQIDLGLWAAEQYRVAGSPVDPLADDGSDHRA
ncbi:DNA gyrase inhibitor YacG [Chitinimonas prasina]|uniref:DNA gyrase inhibitor YacG n=1 Tax=Chitinimonas prasina TaxID=1434937 RepID=UPI0024E171CB|nr:DNA gyrase inhibitor YacG [Chitinimonas prasina]